MSSLPVALETMSFCVIVAFSAVVTREADDVEAVAGVEFVDQGREAFFEEAAEGAGVAQGFAGCD